MEYSMNKLTKMSGVSTRTLRYYDEIGLLKPTRVASSGYRIYGQEQADTLQQILLYRELDFSLRDIKKLLFAPDYDRDRAFASHLSALREKRERLDTLILNVTKSIATMKGEVTMTDQEKFEGFKQKHIDNNEAKYGAEIREKYGDEAIELSNKKIKGMSEEQWQKSQELSAEINEALKAALTSGDPGSKIAQKACDLHRQWLCMFWEEGAYSKEAHKGLAETYVADERFKKYYDAIADGAAVFLRDSIVIYCQE